MRVQVHQDSLSLTLFYSNSLSLSCVKGPTILLYYAVRGQSTRLLPEQICVAASIDQLPISELTTNMSPEAHRDVQATGYLTSHPTG